MTKVGKAALALAAVAVVAVAVVGGGSAAPQQAKTVTIGWAYDGVGAMAPFDGPALATARTRIAEVNRGKLDASSGSSRATPRATSRRSRRRAPPSS